MPPQSLEAIRSKPPEERGGMRKRSGGSFVLARATLVTATAILHQSRRLLWTPQSLPLSNRIESRNSRVNVSPPLSALRQTKTPISVRSRSTDCPPRSLHPREQPRPADLYGVSRDAQEHC